MGNVTVQKVRTQSGLKCLCIPFLRLPLSTGKVWDDYVLYGQTWLVGWKEGRKRVGSYHGEQPWKNGEN